MQMGDVVIISISFIPVSVSVLQELSAIKSQYSQTYEQSLEEHIHSDTSGEFRELLLQLLQGERDQGDTVDSELAVTEAEKLYKVIIIINTCTLNSICKYDFFLEACHCS